MPDKIVNHFVLADGSVARYDYDGLLNAYDVEENSVTFTKSTVAEKFSLFSDGKLYYVVGQDGLKTYSTIVTSNATGAKAFVIPCANISAITYPVFKTTGGYGSFFVDNLGMVTKVHAETTANTGTYKKIVVPSFSDYFVLSIPASLNALDWGLTLEYSKAKSQLFPTMGETVQKADAIAQNGRYSRAVIYRADSVTIGETTLETIDTSGSLNSYAMRIPLDNVKSISFPVFKTTSGYGSFICDRNNVVIWAHTERTLNTGTMLSVDVPDGSSYFVLSVPNSLSSLDYSYSLSVYSTFDIVSPFKNENRNMCLAGIKTVIADNKIPFHEGFLFHKLQNNDNTLWYGNDFKHISKIGTVSYNPTLMRFAISPKDGRVIATQRDTRNGIWVWDGETETHLNSFSTNPQAWLYNSGVDFINYNDTEYCVFAEYMGSVESGRVLNVWRGVYPYTSESDWEIVMSQTQVTDITHFHMVRRDPWTNALYLTAGDSSSESKWWYSTDAGETWTLLVSGNDTGWNNSLARTINFIFTEDYIYWATDHGQSGSQHHTLNRITRNSTTGIIDPSTKEQLSLLPQLFATNSLCYVDTPNGLFMYERIDTTSTSATAGAVKMLFWDFEAEELKTVVELELTQDTWGGSRGKCYVNYTNSVQPYPAMGFSIDTPCIFDLVYPTVSEIGTISYKVGSKTVEIVQY